MLAVEDCLMRATMAEERLGSGGSKDFLGPIGRRLGNRWYHRLTAPSDRPMHELERYAEFLAGLGWPSLPTTLPDLCLPPAKSALAPGYLLIIPDASSPLKSWPMAKFEALACALAEDTDRTIVIAGRKAIGGFGQNLVPLLGRHQLVDMSGQTSVLQFLALIGDAGLVITNDSGGLHFAVAMDRPVLAIGGGGLPERYHPYPAWTGAKLNVVERRLPCYGCSWRCIYDVAPGSPAPCIGDIEVSDVLAVLSEPGMASLQDLPLPARARSAV
jgi:ADP-heptose:LPS heptosyltransferase